MGVHNNQTEIIPITPLLNLKIHIIKPKFQKPNVSNFFQFLIR